MARLSQGAGRRWNATCRCPSRSTSWRCKGIPDAPLRAFLEHHGFRSLLTKLSAQVADAPVPPPAAPCRSRKTRPATTTATRPWSTEDALDRWIAVARHQGWVAIDTETTGKDPMLRRAGRRVDGARPQPRLLRAARARRQRHVRREAGAARPRRRAGEAQAAVRGPGGAQDRAQPQVRHDRARRELRASTSRRTTTRS